MTTTTRRYTRTDLGGTGDVVELHTLVVRFDDDGYVRVHGDALVPLIRSAGYELEQDTQLCEEYLDAEGPELICRHGRRGSHFLTSDPDEGLPRSLRSLAHEATVTEHGCTSDHEAGPCPPHLLRDQPCTATLTIDADDEHLAHLAGTTITCNGRHDYRSHHGDVDLFADRTTLIAWPIVEQ